LLMWAPPASANHALRTTLLRRISGDHAFKYGDERKPVSNYLQQLESGHFLEVDGYRWSSRLWKASFSFEMPAGLKDDGNAAWAGNRPVRTVKLDKHRAPLIKGWSVGFEAINRDFNGLFGDNVEWIAHALAIDPPGRQW